LDSWPVQTYLNMRLLTCSEISLHEIPDLFQTFLYMRLLTCLEKSLHEIPDLFRHVSAYNSRPVQTHNFARPVPTYLCTSLQTLWR
jgi:hypothetical protein